MDSRVLAQLELGDCRFALVDARWPESPGERPVAPHGFALLRPLVATCSAALRRFLRAQGDERPPTGDALVERVAELLARGRLRVARYPLLRPALDLRDLIDLVDISDLAEPLAEPASDDSGAAEQALTHVAFRLVDDAGTPVAGRGFSLALPDGRTLEGVTDADGRFVVDPVHVAGSCTLSLHSAAH
jgi:hypothetical protein